jgi:hypothetical protein
MTLRRSLSIGSVTLLLVAVLTACFPSLPTPGGNTGGNTGGDDATTLSGTWNGEDSDGDVWEIDFQADGTLGISFNGDFSDVAEDTWTQDGTAIEMTVTGFENGDVTFTGNYDGGSSLPLNGSYAGRPFTLTLTEG